MKIPTMTIAVAIVGLSMTALAQTGDMPESVTTQPPQASETATPPVSPPIPMVQGSPCQVGELCPCDDSAMARAPDSDVGQDGPVYDRWQCIYDQEGVLTTMQTDVMAPDGTVERRSIFAFDPAGNLVQEELDEGGDGTIEHRMQFTFDDAGARIGSQWDFGADGVVEQICVYELPCPSPFEQCNLTCERLE